MISLGQLNSAWCRVSFDRCLEWYVANVEQKYEKVTSGWIIIAVGRYVMGIYDPALMLCVSGSHQPAFTQDCNRSPWAKVALYHH